VASDEKEAGLFTMNGKEAGLFTLDGKPCCKTPAHRFSRNVPQTATDLRWQDGHIFTCDISRR